MSTVKPFSAFTSARAAADFPALQLYWHADDYTIGATTWTDRVSGVIANLAAAATKDSDGVYTTVTNSVSSVTGTMPTLSGYAVLVSLGNLATNSTSPAGVNSFIGSANPGPRLTATGIATSNAAADLSSATSLTGTVTALNADPGRRVCQAAYFDLVDTTSPLIARALSSNLSTNVISNGTSTTTDTGQIVLGGALDDALSIAGLGGNNDGRRQRIIALFDFTSPLTASEIQIAAAEMARTGELFAGWINRT